MVIRRPTAGHRDSAIVDKRSSVPIAEILRGNWNCENNRVCVEQPVVLESITGELIIRRA
jgi:hypothetical protein